MSLKIGQVAKLLGLSAETIRFYEQENIVSPSRIEDSKYRAYDKWDIYYLLECMFYRSLDLPVRDIAQILHQEDLDYLKCILRKKEADIRKTIKYETTLLEYIEKFHRKLETVEVNVGNYWFRKLPERKCLIYIDSEKDDIDSESGILTEWIKHFPLVEGAQYIYKNDFINGVNPKSELWSLVVNSNLVPILELPLDDSIRTIGEQLCLCTIIDAGEREIYSMERLAAVLKYINSMDMEIAGDIVGHFLVKTHIKSVKKRYIEIMVPVRIR